MRLKVIGMKNSSFTPKDSDTEIAGTTLYFGRVVPNVEGMLVDKVFVSARVALPAGLKIGSEIDLEYNKFGKVDSVRLA